MTSKLPIGGGDATLHSSVPAPHGSGPDMAPVRRLRTTFARNSSTPTAMIAAPMLDTRFMPPHPVSAGYVYTRRGMPHNPSRCSGKNVTLKPMKNSQKFQRPRRSPNSRPVNLGNQ